MEIKERLEEESKKKYPIKERYNKKGTGIYDANFSKRMAFNEGYECMRSVLIDKACEWLLQHQDDYLDYDAWKGNYTNFERLIVDFKKAMKE